MRNICHLFVAVFIVIALLAGGCERTQRENDLLYQTSTINALLQGVYDGNTTFKELHGYGDFGLGTFNGLDGEMVGLDGEFYQVKVDGVAYPVADSMRTPFAVVTPFESDSTLLSGNISDLTQLCQYLDSLLPTKNMFHAIRMDGVFEYVKTRSVPSQSKPYPPLAEAIEKQRVFEFHDVEGTIVGFRCPAYVEGVNVSGYHFHFITADRKAGGHVLDCSARNVTIAIDYTPDFYMDSPETDAFYEADLGEGQQTDLEKVEKGTTHD